MTTPKTAAIIAGLDSVSRLDGTTNLADLAQAFEQELNSRGFSVHDERLGDLDERLTHTVKLSAGSMSDHMEVIAAAAARDSECDSYIRALISVVHDLTRAVEAIS
jgi:hypothetical protein